MPGAKQKYAATNRQQQTAIDLHIEKLSLARGASWVNDQNRDRFLTSMSVVLSLAQ
jgi:hypothetical protein